MLLEVQSDKTVEQLREELPRAAMAHKFGLLGIHDLRAKMKEKGIDFDGEVLVFEVCNPNKAKAVLEKAPEASSILPCRISVYRDARGKTRLSTIRPTGMVAALGFPGLAAIAADVEKDLIAIMADAK